MHAAALRTWYKSSDVPGPKDSGFIINVSRYYQSFVTTQSSPINPPFPPRYLCLTNLFQGNAELLSISSDDSIWKSEDEDIGDTKSEGKHEHLFL